MPNFKSVLAEFNIQIAPHNHHHSRPGWIQFDCPFCGEGTRKYHMGYRESGRYVNCWRCGRHDLVTTLVNLGCKTRGLAVGIVRDLPRKRVSVNRISGDLKVPKGVAPMGAAHRKYLKRRRYRSKDVERLWGVQGIGLASRLSWSLYIPIYLNGQQVSWTTRAIGEHDGPKYVSAAPEEEMKHHKDLLYGEDYVRDTVVIVEGPFDVWRFGPGAVATLGTGWSEEQLYRLSKYRNRVVCYDPEVEAQAKARALINSLMAFDGDTYSIVIGDDEKDYSDLDDCPQELINGLRTEVLGFDL